LDVKLASLGVLNISPRVLTEQFQSLCYCNEHWSHVPVLMRTKRIEMRPPAQLWSGVPHGARAAVLRPEMFHEWAAVAVKANVK